MGETRDDPRRRVWDRLQAQPGTVRRVDVRASPVLAPGAFRLGQLTALVGLHGSGKSYLLSVIDHAFPRGLPRSGLPVDSDDHGAGLRGCYSLAVERDGQTVHVGLDLPIPSASTSTPEQDSLSLLVSLVTPYKALWELSYVASNWPSRTFPYPRELRRLRRSQLDTVGSITGHTYDWLEFGWVEDDATAFPFVRGSRASRTIESWSLSASEFWVLYVLSLIWDADADDVILIDEPETFLAPPAHGSFIDEIARATLAAGCQTVLSTHSEQMIRRMPEGCVLLLTSGPEGSEVHHVASTRSVLRALSRTPTAPSVLVFVEDALGVRITRAILLRFARHLADLIDVVDSGGCDEAVAATRVVRRSAMTAAVALLDGDQRGVHSGPGILFLPGDRAPEVDLLEALRSRAEPSAAKLGVDQADLFVALEATRFVPHQRVFDVVAGSLGGLTAPAVSEVAIAAWLDSPNVDAAARRLASDIAGQARPAAP